MENMTAKVSCFARAYHYRNNTTHVFADSMAEALLGEDYSQIAGSMAKGIPFFLPGFEGTAEEGLRRIVDRQLSPSVLGRSAYCERTLEEERRNGCRQYVLFAAGYDSFALRNANTDLAVYELDLPEMLEDKAARIRRAALSSCAVSVPCNLAQPGWTEKTIGMGFDPGRKAFGSLLGIGYYLGKSEWENLIRMISGIMRAGSVLCFDYPCQEGSGGMEMTRSLAKGAGEEMRSVYTYQEMQAILETGGFFVKEHLDHDGMNGRFFAE